MNKSSMTHTRVDYWPDGLFKFTFSVRILLGCYFSSK